MLGQPVYFLTPDVVGFELTGQLREGVTATDLVLTVTEMLRKEKVVGKFVEFFGEGTRSAVACPTARPSANMAPEYGATMGFFPVDDKTDRVLRRHRPHAGARSRPSRPTSRRRACSACRAPGEIDYTQVVTLDLGTRHAEPGRARSGRRTASSSARSRASSPSLFSKPPPRTASTSRRRSC